MADKIEEEIPEEPGFPIGTTIVFIGLIILIGLGLYFFILRGRINLPFSGQTGQKTTPSPSAASSGTELKQADKIFKISASDFSFNPSEIKVKKGDTVKIFLINNKGTHNLVIDEFNARTGTINAGQVSEVTFLADKTGTFEFYSGVDNDRANGMVGKLIVE